VRFYKHKRIFLISLDHSKARICEYLRVNILVTQFTRYLFHRNKLLFLSTTYKKSILKYLFLTSKSNQYCFVVLAIQ